MLICVSWRKPFFCNGILSLHFRSEFETLSEQTHTPPVVEHLELKPLHKIEASEDLWSIPLQVLTSRGIVFKLDHTREACSFHSVYGICIFVACMSDVSFFRLHFPSFFFTWGTAPLASFQDEMGGIGYLGLPVMSFLNSIPLSQGTRPAPIYTLLPSLSLKLTVFHYTLFFLVVTHLSVWIFGGLHPTCILVSACVHLVL